MMRMVVDAKKLGLTDRFCTTTPSITRTSRCVTCSIHWRRMRLVAARIDACVVARRFANIA